MIILVVVIVVFRKMITIFVAPESPLQTSKPTLPPPSLPIRQVLDWIDQRILDLVRECQPVKLWHVLNLVAEETSPRSRAEGRELRMKLWHKVRRLIGLGLALSFFYPDSGVLQQEIRKNVGVGQRPNFQA